MQIRSNALGAVLAIAFLCCAPSQAQSQQNTPVVAVGEIQSSYANWDTAMVQKALESALRDSQYERFRLTPEQQQ